MSHLHSPHGWFRYDPASNRWYPTDRNRFSDWKNAVVTDVFKPDERGISRWVEIDTIKAKFPEQANQFGGNGSNFFTRNSPAVDFAQDTRTGPKRQITARRFTGLASATSNTTSRTIRAEILRTIRAQPCALSGAKTDIECDHKCSKRPPNTNPQLQHLSDFQPLSKTANDRKRSVCNECMRTHQRFDARTLGYSIGWVNGDADSSTCVGCYWHDIHYFRSSLILSPDHEP